MLPFPFPISIPTRRAAGPVRAVGAFLAFVAASAGAQEITAETWETGYTGGDANGPRVLAFWRFEPGAVTADTSGRGQVLSLSGATSAAEGRFGGGLESFPGWPVEDKRHAALAASAPALSPPGAFTLEMWVKPKPEFTTDLSPVLVDKKYVAHTDYQWRLTAADRSGLRRMMVSLGFGEDSETYYSDTFALTAGWQHLAFTYDGGGGVQFFRDGTLLGEARRPGRAAVAAGSRPLSIGDRGGSYYAGFPGYLDEVRLCEGVREFRTQTLNFRLERQVWRRMEPAPWIGVVVSNPGIARLPAARLQVGVAGRPGEQFAVPALAAGATYEVMYRFDTSLRPDAYRLVARLETTTAPVTGREESRELVLARRPPPHRLPVVMWGIGGVENVRKELPRLQDLGFTHCLAGNVDLGAIWDAKKPIPPTRDDRVAATKAMLDLALAQDFGIAFSLSPGGWLKDRAELQRVDRAGNPLSPPDADAALPGLAEFGYNVGASVAQTYQAFPAWQAALINTEVRDSSQPSFSTEARAAYRQLAGTEIPAEISTKRGVDWRKLPNFPADRVIADDHPLRRYLHWFWTEGDGWNALHTAVHRGLHATGRDDLWTWFDPTIRAASVGGSGGAVDVLSQWTYTNPDPLRIGYFADELFAMAALAPQRPRVMKMTQLFWYRSQTAPLKTGSAFIPSPFDDSDPDAAYITITSAHLRESFWTKLARPVQGLMYHGWQALVPTDGTSSYRYTQPETQLEFRRLHRQVVEPLGPTLLQVGETGSDVAYLDSFTAQMFAGRGSYGYSSEETYLTLLYAQLQPEVVFEETILRRGLGSFRVLVLADCDVLPASVVQRIQEFQRAGGLVIGDENLAPALVPGIRLKKYTRLGKAAADHAALLANAAQLRTALDARYSRPVDSSQPEVIARRRTAGSADYVFVVNDRREAGTYVGQHGLVMENGVSLSAELSLRRPTGFVYDLRAGRVIAATARNGRLTWPVDLAGGDGGIFLVTPQPIRALHCDAPPSARTGEPVAVTITVADDAGRPVPAVLPLQVTILDAAGRLAELSGFYGAKDGALRLRLDVAPNDLTGTWKIQVRELASGLTATRDLTVQEGSPTAGANAAPRIVNQLGSAQGSAGSALSLFVNAAGQPAPSYQWFKDGQLLAGATDAALVLPVVFADDQGTYTVVVTNPLGRVISRAIPVTILPSAARLINVGARALVAGSDATVIAGFVIGGQGSKRLLIRGAGPALSQFGVGGVLADPRLALYAGTRLIAENDDWAAPVAEVQAAVGAFAFPERSRDAALVCTLDPGGYTVHLNGALAGGAATTGVALVEIFELDSSSATEGSPRLVNLSTRAMVGTGENILIPGLVLGPPTLPATAARLVLVRAVGPGLGAFGVNGPLARPRLVIRDRDGAIAAENTGWQQSANREAIVAAATRVGAFPLQPLAADSAVLVALRPAGYTIEVSGADGGSGIALVEIYEVP